MRWIMLLLKTSGILLGVALAGVLLAAATRSDTFRVQRSTSMKAPADRIYPLINDLHRFNTWNPFERKDPNLTRSYSGAERGKAIDEVAHHYQGLAGQKPAGVWTHAEYMNCEW